MNNGKSIALVTNSLFNFENYRSPLTQKLIENGHDVTIIAPLTDEVATKFSGENLKFVDWNIDRSSLNPLVFLRNYSELKSIVKSNKYDHVLPFTLKPILYTCIIPGCKVLATITGFGKIREKRFVFYAVVALLYITLLLRKSTALIVQNNVDYDLFNFRHLIKNKKVFLTPGSGVDHKESQRDKYNREKIVWVGRGLKSKGIREYANFIKSVNLKYPKRFQFLAFIKEDLDHEDALTRKEIECLLANVVDIEWNVSNVEDFLCEADVLFYYSNYYEGFPKVILEAFNNGLFVISNRFHGYSTLLRDQENCFLYDVGKNKTGLDALDRLIELSYRDLLIMVDECNKTRSKTCITKIANVYLEEIKKS